jgi:Fur family peroxide stress response transcriptional regulator
MSKPTTSGNPDNAQRLRDAGLRVTAPRLAILDALEGDWRHPGAEEIYETLSPGHPSLSLSTVYLTLEAFVRTGLIRKVSGTDGRLRVDGTIQDHDHAVCQACGTIFDVDRQQFPRADLPRRLPRGLEVRRVRVEYDVICSACRKGGPNPGRKSKIDKKKANSRH